jgi:hypothetical protein
MNPKNIKIVEIRDRATCIPAFAIRLLPEQEEEIFLFKHAGYRSIANPCIMLISIAVPQHCARYSGDWSTGRGRSMRIAHEWIEKKFEEIVNCQVIDVEFILGEVDKPCKSIIYEYLDEVIKQNKN